MYSGNIHETAKYAVCMMSEFQHILAGDIPLHSQWPCTWSSEDGNMTAPLKLSTIITITISMSIQGVDAPGQPPGLHWQHRGSLKTKGQRSRHYDPRRLGFFTACRTIPLSSSQLMLSSINIKAAVEQAQCCTHIESGTRRHRDCSQKPLTESFFTFPICVHGTVAWELRTKIDCPELQPWPGKWLGKRKNLNPRPRRGRNYWNMFRECRWNKKPFITNVINIPKS